MPVITREEQRLAHETLIRQREVRNGRRVPAAKLIGEAAIDGAEGGEEGGFVARGGGDGEAEGAGRADGFLDEVGERPAAADVGYVCGGGGGDGGGVVDEVGD